MSLILAVLFLLTGLRNFAAADSTFNIKVQYAGGQTINGVTVEVLDNESGSLITSGVTSGGGRVSFTLADGSYRLRAYSGSLSFLSTDHGPKQVYNIPPDTSATITFGVTWVEGDIPVNKPPVLDPIGDKTVNEDELLQFTISATDPDGNPLIYSASNLPDGANFDAGSRTFSWTPRYDQAGSYPNVHFGVSDGTLTDSEDITITVVNANQPPVADAGPDQTVEQSSYAGAEVTLDGSGSSDPDGDTLTYEWAWASGTASGVNPTATFPLGSTTVTLTVSDGELSANDTVEINVVDSTPPVVTITAPAEGSYQTATLPALAYTVVEANPYTVVESGWSTDEGTHTVTVTATDAAGNVGSASRTYTVDNTSPVVTITAPTNGSFYKTANVPAAAYDVTEANDYTILEEGYLTTEGPQTYTVTATDAAGNWGAASVHYTVDNTPPEILINYPVDQAIYKLGAMPTEPDISVSDELDVDGASYTYTGYDTSLGTHTMTVTAVDTAGNTSTTSVIYQVQKHPKTTSDMTGPVITIKSPKAKTYYTYQTLKIFFGVKDKDSGVATKQATLDGTVVKNLQKIDLSKLAIGSHTFTVTAMDNLGNSSTKTVTFNVQVGVLKAKIRVMPSTLNLKSQSDKNAVTATINLPCGISEKNIDISTVMMTINGVQISAIALGNHSCGYTVKFDRQQVINALQGLSGKVTVTVTGALKNGTQFSGKDTITVISQGYPKKH